MMMRVLLILMLLGTMAFAFGCSDGSDTASTQATASDSETTAAVETTEAEELDPLALPWGSTVDLDGLQITLAEPVDDTANLDEGEKMLLGEGEKAVYCMAVIANNSEDVYGYNTLSFTMYDTDGLSYESLMSVSSQPDLGSGDVLPGKTVKGAVAFTIPAASTPAYVNFQPDIMSDTEASWGAGN